MKEKEKNRSFEYLRTVVLPVILLSAVAGAASGFAVALFNYAGTKLSAYSGYIYGLVRENPAFVPLLFFGLVTLAVLMHFLLRAIPEVKGSGIPRTEGALKGLLKFDSLRVVAGTYAGSFLSFFAGLPLGSEGPSVQIGAFAAEGFAGLIPTKYPWRRYVSTGGASAGLAVAFHAPITGIIFALEDVHRSFNPRVLISAITAVVFGMTVADATALLWGGAESSFLWFATGITAVPMKYSWTIFVSGLAVGLIAVAFNFLLIKIGKLGISRKTPRLVKLIAVFVLVGIAGLFLADSLGGGLGLIAKLMNGGIVWTTVLILLVVKLVLIVLSFDSGATGGLFVPMLAIGALVGALFAELFVSTGVLDAAYYNTVVLVSMAAFLGAVVRAPITALVLIIEATAGSIGFLSCGIGVFAAFIVAEVLMRRPLYDVLLDRELREKYHGKAMSNRSVDIAVEEGSFAAGKAVREIMWPVNCLVHTVIRGDETIIAKAKTRLETGDVLHIQASLYEENEFMEDLNGICKKPERPEFRNSRR